MANTLLQTAFLRPKLKAKVGNLYFTGQLTVPGPGTTGINIRKTGVRFN
jgi:phytoene desaturase